MLGRKEWMEVKEDEEGKRVGKEGMKSRINGKREGEEEKDGWKGGK